MLIPLLGNVSDPWLGQEAGTAALIHHEGPRESCYSLPGCQLTYRHSKSLVTQG